MRKSIICKPVELKNKMFIYMQPVIFTWATPFYWNIPACAALAKFFVSVTNELSSSLICHSINPLCKLIANMKLMPLEILHITWSFLFPFSIIYSIIARIILHFHSKDPAFSSKCKNLKPGAYSRWPKQFSSTPDKPLSFLTSMFYLTT